MRRTRLLSLVAAVALMAMACGDDADTGPATTSVPASTPTSAPTTTSPPSITSAPTSTTTSTTTTTPSTSPPSSSTTSPAVTLGEVVASIEHDIVEQFPSRPQGRIVCDEPADTIVDRGTVLYCDAEMPPGYEAGTWLIVVTDDTGTAAYTAATDMVDLHDWFGPGLLCRELLAQPYLAGIPRNLSYLFLLAYWFQDGQPDRMDADLDGIPCETLFDPAVVDAVWAGGYVT